MSTPSSPRPTLREFVDFFGASTVWYIVAGAAAGVGLFTVEVAFAYALQLFLQTIGVMPGASLRLPLSLPAPTLHVVLAAVFGLGAIRSLLLWVFISSQGLADEGTRRHQRSHILGWALNAGSASLSDVTTLFNAQSIAAGQTVFAVQSLAVQLTSAFLLSITLLVMAPRVTLTLAAALLVLVPPLRWADRRTNAAGARARVEWERLSRILIVSIKNLLFLQIYGTQDLERERGQHSLENFHSGVRVYYVMSGFKFALPQICGLLLVCLVALAGKRSGLESGLLVTYFYLFLRLMQTFALVNQFVSMAAVYWPQAKPLLAWWRLRRDEFVPAAPRGRVQAGEAAGPATPVGWRFDGVSYAYPNADVSAVSGLSFSIPAGTAAAITGASGSGKSTILNLLLGVLRPTRGAVVVTGGPGGDRSIGDSRAELLRGVGYVGPESFLIEGTVRENLLYGLHRTPADEEIFEALDLAQCGFIRELPRGLEHLLTEQGQGLSAGQKQRLTLARALLKNPRVLILDEATANLDRATEALLVETLKSLKGRMTIITATHSQAMLAIADQRIQLEPAAKALES